jgi:dipeptidase E
MKILLTSVFSKVGDLLFKLTAKNPKELSVAFIPTASNPYKEKPWILTDRNKLIQMGLNVVDIDLEKENENTLKEKLSKLDIIFVAGGNTVYLLAKSIESGFKKMLKELLSNGKIYVGSSAGSILAGPSHEPFKDEELKELDRAFKIDSFDGAALVKYIVLPHFNQEKYLKESINTLKKYGQKYQIKTLNDNQAILIDGETEELVTRD